MLAHSTQEGGRGSSRGWQGEELCEPDVASTVGAGAVTAGLVGLVATRFSPAHRLKAAALHTVAGAALAFPLGESHLISPCILVSPPATRASPAHRIKAAALHTVLPSPWPSCTRRSTPYCPSSTAQEQHTAAVARG
ncbi:unnamed protein product [Closterium sp. Yama58-4]|nr:unnamed protein product [Closterium sp. Yama58-4]